MARMRALQRWCHIWLDIVLITIFGLFSSFCESILALYSACVASLSLSLPVIGFFFGSISVNFLVAISASGIIS